MINFRIISLFPESFGSYFSESILKRALEKKIIDITFFNPRDFTKDTHKTADDKPYGGGPGMVVKAEPILKAVEAALKSAKKPVKVILFSAGGKQFDAKQAREWAKKYKTIVMICGRYEGIDERVCKILQTTSYKLQSISVGPYVLTGGEVPAMLVTDAVARHIPGVLGKNESLEERRYGTGLAAYTRPEALKYKGKTYKVPKVLLSGNHNEIEKFRAKKGLPRTPR